MSNIDIVLIVVAVFWFGFVIGLEVSDRFWEPLWKEASDGWFRNVAKKNQKDGSRNYEDSGRSGK